MQATTTLVATDETDRLIAADKVVGTSEYDLRTGGYVVDLDRRRLEGAPSYSASDLPDWSDREYGHRIDDYYGVPPYGI
jgi:hypothetical protein